MLSGKVAGYAVYYGYTLSHDTEKFDKNVKKVIDNIFINRWKSVTFEQEGRDFEVVLIDGDFHVEDVTGRFE